MGLHPKIGTTKLFGSFSSLTIMTALCSSTGDDFSPTMGGHTVTESVFIFLLSIWLKCTFHGSSSLCFQYPKEPQI